MPLRCTDSRLPLFLQELCSWADSLISAANIAAKKKLISASARGSIRIPISFCFVVPDASRRVAPGSGKTMLHDVPFVTRRV